MQEKGQELRLRDERNKTRGNPPEGTETMEKNKRDLTLVKKAMRGNPKAFGELVRQEQEYLYRMAFLYTHQEEDALDAVQESVLKAYQSLKTLREPSYFKTWLTRIVINTATDICRKRRPAEDLESIGELPAAETLSVEARMDLYDALERLPEKYRDVVKLKYFDGLTIREIAEITEQAEGTVSSQLTRAIRLLRSDLTEREESKCGQM